MERKISDDLNFKDSYVILGDKKKSAQPERDDFYNMGKDVRAIIEEKKEEEFEKEANDFQCLTSSYKNSVIVYQKGLARIHDKAMKEITNIIFSFKRNYKSYNKFNVTKENPVIFLGKVLNSNKELKEEYSKLIYFCYKWFVKPIEYKGKSLYSDMRILL